MISELLRSASDVTTEIRVNHGEPAGFAKNESTRCVGGPVSDPVL